MHNILFVESGTTGGGSFENLYQYLRVIDKQKFRPVVVFLNHTRFVALIKDLGFKVHVLNDPLYSARFPSFTRKLTGKACSLLARRLDRAGMCLLRLVHVPLIKSLKNIISKERISLLYLNDQINRDLFGIFAARDTGLPVISHLRSMDGVTFSPRKARLANQYVSAFISNSKSTKRYWEERGVDSRKSLLVYNAIAPLEATKPDIREPWNISEEANFIIGCVGRLVPLKGHLFLLRAFGLFVRKHPDSVLVIIGDGPMRKELEQEAKTLNIKEKVVFTGYQENAGAMMGALDLLVLPSRYDAFGRVLLEAMQQGTPVIGTDLHGITEIIEHEKNGLLVPYDDQEALCAAMERVLTDHALREKFVENAFQTIKEKFSMDDYKKNIENILSSVLTG